MDNIIKWSRKWSFVVMLLVTGIIYLTCTDNWQVYFRASGRAAEEELSSEMPKKEHIVHNEPLRDVSSVKQENVFGDVSQNGAGSENPHGENTGGENMNGENAGGEGSAGGDSGGEASVDGDSGGAGSGGETSVSVGDGQTEQPYWEDLTYRDPEDIVYKTVEDSYFADAVFLGDSRTVGMYEYGGLKEISTFYASTGLNIYKLLEAKIVEEPNQKEKISVEQALQENHFEKIYLMIGINEMGTGTVESFMEKYQEVVARIQELQPDAIIYLQGIMKVSAERSSKGDYIHNEGIEARNTEIEKLADNIRIYYLDVNPYICDESGGMESTYTYDGVHLKAQYVPIWKDYLKSHAVDKLMLD